MLRESTSAPRLALIGPEVPFLWAGWVVIPMLGLLLPEGFKGNSCLATGISNELREAQK